MTEEAVRAIFFKNYSGGSLNEALIATIEELSLAVIRECVGEERVLPDIVKTIEIGKSRIGLFGRIKDGVSPMLPMSFIVHFDEIRKAMVDVLVYMHDNFEAADPAFRQSFTKEDLADMASEITLAMEKGGQRPVNVRAFHSSELMLYDEIFDQALMGIIGLEPYQRFAQEYNRCTTVLEQCQTQGQLLRHMKPGKAS